MALNSKYSPMGGGYFRLLPSSWINLADTERRLRQLLADFRFGPTTDTVVVPAALAA